MAVVLLDHRARPGRHLPAALQRGLRRQRGLDRHADARRRRSSSPASRRRSPSGCSSSTSAPRASSTSARSARSAIAIWLGPGTTTIADDRARCASAAAAGGALWALIPGVLKAFARTNEIITTLMLNYVAGLLLTYLIFDSASPWRDVSTIEARSFPQVDRRLPTSQFWPTWSPRGVVVPFGFLLALGVAVGLWFALPADAVRLRDERDRRLAARRPLLGHAHAAEDPRGDGPLRRASPGSAAPARSATSRTSSTPARRASRARPSATPGIVVAALGRYNPLAVVPRRRADRRAPERRALPPGPRLPDRARRRACRGSSSSARSAASC